MVLGVGSVIKVHNRMAAMAISLSRLIPRIIHQPVGPVSDHEEGCRWSGERRWLKRREPLRREGARYANILKCLILSIVLAPKFFICITNQAKHTTEKRTFSTLLHEVQVNSRVKESSLPRLSRTQHLYGNYLKGHTVYASPEVNGKQWTYPSYLNDFIAIQLLRKIYSWPWNIPGLSPDNTAAALCCSVCTVETSRNPDSQWKNSFHANSFITRFRFLLTCWSEIPVCRMLVASGWYRNSW